MGEGKSEGRRCRWGLRRGEGMGKGGRNGDRGRANGARGKGRVSRNSIRERVKKGAKKE